MQMAEDYAIQKLSYLDLDWANEVLSYSDELSVADSVSINQVNIGTTTRVRFQLDFADNTTCHWFIKLPSLSWRARMITALPRLLSTEIQFYEQISGYIKIPVPTRIYSNDTFWKSVLVLQNISSQDCMAGHPADVLSLQQAESVVRVLAELHAQFWQSEKLSTELSWLSGPVRQLEDRLGNVLAVPLMRRALKLAANDVPADIQRVAMLYAQQRSQVMSYLNSAEKTLVHHDLHPGNLFWKQNQVGLLDWQMVRSGEGVSDLAYFIATALEPEMQHQHQSYLIQCYLDLMSQHSVSLPGTRLFMKKFHAHLLYPLEAMLVTLAIGGMMDLSSNYKLIARAVNAVELNRVIGGLEF